MATPKKQKPAKVGIFMPSYNMGPFIDEALESLYAQSFQDFVVIIADDASPSKESVEKLKTIERPRVKVFFEKKNLGIVAISNKYIPDLDAEYIMMFSPDDKMHPDFLKEQVAYLDSHKNTQAVCTWIQEFGDGDTLIKYNDELCTIPHMLIDNHFSGAALTRKEAWLAAGMNDTDKGLYPNHDYDLWLSMLDKGYKLGTIPKVLFYWRIRRKSLSHGVDMQQVFTFRKALLKKYSHLYKEYSDFVIGQYLEKFNQFEEYYQTSEEGHAWLDQQYKSLTTENALLKAQLSDSKRSMFDRVYGRAIRFLRSRKSSKP